MDRSETSIDTKLLNSYHTFLEHSFNTLSLTMRTFPAVVIANYFVEKAKEGDTELTILKLMKLIYIAHGWHLGYSGKPLIREDVEAWKYGPVIRSVYDAFRRYGASLITERAPTGPSGGPDVETISEGDTHNLPAFLNAIWDAYGSYTGGQLSEMTHKKGTPWDETWNDQSGKTSFGSVIVDGQIREYYEQRTAAGTN